MIPARICFPIENYHRKQALDTLRRVKPLIKWKIDFYKRCEQRKWRELNLKIQPTTVAGLDQKAVREFSKGRTILHTAAFPGGSITVGVIRCG